MKTIKYILYLVYSFFLGYGVAHLLLGIMATYRGSIVLVTTFDCFLVLVVGIPIIIAIQNFIMKEFSIDPTSKKDKLS